MRILVAIPTYDRRVDIDIARGLLRLEREGHDFDLIMPVSSHISRNRNLAAHELLKGDYDWLLFWDSDIGLEEGFLKKMLETAYKHDADIVCGCYKMKEENGKYVLGIKNGDRYENLTEIRQVREVDAGGTGCLLIKRRVLEALSEPWFTIEDGNNLFVLPEDFRFCKLAKEKGFKIMADPRFKTHHFGVKSYSHGMA